MVTDRDGRIEWANPAFSKITGESNCHSLALGLPAPALSKIPPPDQTQPGMDHILATPCWEGDLLLHVKDGSWRPVFVRKEPLPTTFAQNQFVWILRDLSQIRSLQEKLDLSENYHPLTQLPNRTFLKNRLKHSLEQARRDNTYVGLLHIDLDQFKRINTSVGHAAGDELLIRVSQRLQNTTRKADTLLHLEGDSFAVILEKLPQSREAATVANRIMNELSTPFTLQDKKIYVNASIGISIYPLDASDCETMFLHAEEAMQAQKNCPQSGYQYYDRKHDGATFALLRFEADLRQAVKNNEFSLAFQPQVRLADWTLRGVEALARWHSVTRGSVSPRQFIPVAEKTGLISALGRWVLNTACHIADAWETGPGPGSCLIAVNVSGIQFADPGFPDQVEKALAHSGLSPDCLELEITETMVLQEKLKAVQALQALRDMGVRIAIDDFGTGHSCLAILKELPVDTLKIDKKFLRQVPQCPQSTSLIKTILNIQHALDLEIVVEGVEYKEQVDFLLQQGCPVIQGFWFSPPLPETDFLDFCQTRNWTSDSPFPGAELGG